MPSSNAHKPWRTTIKKIPEDLEETHTKSRSKKGGKGDLCKQRPGSGGPPGEGESLTGYDDLAGWILPPWILTPSDYGELWQPMSGPSFVEMQ